MNSRGLSKLRCPTCKGILSNLPFIEEQLDLPEKLLTNSKIKISDQESFQKVIKEGVLLCSNCKVWYPIFSYVPVMLIFRTPFHDKFARRYQTELTSLAEYSVVGGKPEPGEMSIQKTFTEEWLTLKDDEMVFSYTKDELKLFHKKVLLKWPDDAPVNVREILNIGCGFGAEANTLHEISDGAEVFGIDLNFSLFHAHSSFLKNPFIHLIVASLFHLPFKEESFDLVYSQGVLHHTYNTYEAFKSIFPFVRKQGQLGIWLYALEDSLIKERFARLRALLEFALRPIISRSPAIIRQIAIYILSIIINPLCLIKSRHKKDWKLKHTIHSVRDWLTPRYAHRHSFNEVIEWFESHGFTYDLHSPATCRKLLNRRLWGIGITGYRLS